MYFYGHGVQQNYTEAIKLFKISASDGYAVAQYTLGLCYENGIELVQDSKEAYKWYRLATERGNKEAYEKMKFLPNNNLLFSAEEL